MYQNYSVRNSRVFRLVALTILLLAAIPALAQANLRATKIGERSVKIRWDEVPSATFYGVSVNGHTVVHFSNPSVRSYTVTGLRPSTSYRIVLGWNGGQDSLSVRTAGGSTDDHDDPGEREEPRYTPPPVTCPHLPNRVIVTGFVVNTQCQMVGNVVLAGYPDLQARGFIDAVDVWLYVNGGLEVCFRNDGWLVLLDATYIRRMPTELEHSHRDGMTCGHIDGIGTVVLLASPPHQAPAAQPAANTLPVFETIPLHDCQIKLVETLFLRARPAGEIIGLVWLNSEVPALEINGYWYQIEFEGTTGYISRYYREVLRGGCG